jgi:hypothetical protein
MKGTRTMTHWLRRNPAIWVAAGLGMGLLVGVGMMIGTLCGVWSAGSGGWTFPETVLHAEAATGCETMAVATGVIDEDVEGLFTLDFLTGELSCFVLYAKGPLAQKLGATFKTNVAAAFGAIEQGKKPHYLLITGKANFTRGTGAGAVRPAYSVCYVVDTNTGKWVAYGIPWNQTASAQGRLQEAVMVPLANGVIRSAQLRENP